MTTSTASARRRAPSGLRRTVGGFPLWFFGSMMAMGVVAATVGLSQPASPSIGAPFSSVFVPARAILGIVYWTILTLVGSTMVVKVRNGAVYGSFIAFVVAAAVLGGPPAAVVVGLVGTLELRELRELRPPQIATNHVEPVVGAVVASFAAGWVAEGLTQTSIGSAALAALIVTATATLAFMLPSTALAYVGLALRRRRSLREVAREQLGTILLFSLVAAATAWVMVETYVLVAWWSPIVILGPVLASWLALDRDRARW